MEENERDKHSGQNWKKGLLFFVYITAGIIGALLYQLGFCAEFVEIEIISMIMKFFSVLESTLMALGVCLVQLPIFTLKDSTVQNHVRHILIVICIVWCFFLGISLNSQMITQEKLVSPKSQDEEISGEELEHIKQVTPNVIIIVVNDNENPEIVSGRKYIIKGRTVIEPETSDIIRNLLSQVINRWKYGEWMYAKIKITVELVPEEREKREDDTTNEVNLKFWDELITLDDSHIAYLNDEQEHGEIRYKLDGGNWSNWIPTDLEAEFVVSTDKKSVSCVQWRQGNQQTESRNIEGSETEIFFIDRGGFELDDEVLKQLFAQYADEFRETDYEPEIKVSSFADEVKCIGWKNEEISISFDESNLLYMKAGDEILYRCYVDNSLKGTYKAYLSKKGSDESVKWVEVSGNSLDESLIILDVNFVN